MNDQHNSRDVDDATDAEDINESVTQATSDEDAVARKITSMEDTSPTNDNDHSVCRCPGETTASDLPLVPAVNVEVDRTQTENDTAGSQEDDENSGRKMVGKKVKTTYGPGVVADYRSKDGTYVIQLSSNSDKDSPRSKTTLYTVEAPELREQSQGELAQQLNVAYEALENMRRLNLDVQCHEVGIASHEINYDMCTACLLANKGATKSHFPRLQRWMDSATEATTELDEKMQRWVDTGKSATIELDEKIQSLFLSTSSSMSIGAPSRDPNRAQQFQRLSTLFGSTVSSSSESVASRVSASLQAAPNNNNKSPEPDASKSASTTAKQEPPPSTSLGPQADASDKTKPPEETENDNINGTENVTASSSVDERKGPSSTAIVDASSEESETSDSEPAPNSTVMPAEAAAAFSAHPPPSQTKKAPGSSNSFPRMRKLWGSIQSLPQPTTQNLPSSSSILTSMTSNGLSLRGISASTSNTTTTPTPSATNETASATSSSRSFPRMQGLLNSSISTRIFGENQVKESGSTADPNILLHGSQRGGRSIDKKPPPKVKRDKPTALPRIQNLINQRTQANTSPCLICASPSCPSHSSPSFRKEGITLCLQCERLFELDFIIDCVSSPDPTKRSELIDYMIDCYDRCMLLLQYSKQFAQQIAISLEDQKEKQDKIGLASSSVGVLSGVLGIAAAASILTPAGPPLLIASLFFGGGATTVQTGTEAINYFSEPRKLADRIIALHGMALSILRVTSTLRDAMLRDHIRTDVYEAEPCPADLTNQVKESLEKNKNAVVMGSNFGRSLTLGAGLAGAEAGAMGAVAAGEVAAVSAAGASAAGASSAVGATAATAASTAGAAGARSATAISRAGTAAARTVRFARFAGGALSAAVLVMEANAIQSTVKSIKEGSPCDKAERLRNVIEEIGEFPSTSDLDDECQAYLTALANRPSPPVEVSAVPDNGTSARAEDIPEATCQHVDQSVSDSQLCAPGVMIVDGVNNFNNTEDQPPPEGTAAAVPVATNSSFLGSSSLFQRLQARREERQSLASSQADEVIAVAVDDNELGASNFSLVL